jgi:hypothetical protein
MLAASPPDGAEKFAAKPLNIFLHHGEASLTALDRGGAAIQVESTNRVENINTMVRT